MLEKIRKILKLQEEGIKVRPLRHLALTIDGVRTWVIKEGKQFDEAYARVFSTLNSIIELQAGMNIPIITIYLMPEEMKSREYFQKFLDAVVSFFSALRTAETVHNNKIKITALGKWYDLPNRAVEPIKQILEETKDYDTFFLNFCINYNGQEEIADACRLIARQLSAGRISVDAVTKELIKDNVYSSYFLPPDLIIKNGVEKKLSGFLLWDSAQSEICFTGKPFPYFTIEDFKAAIEDYQKERI